MNRRINLIEPGDKTWAKAFRYEDVRLVFFVSVDDFCQQSIRREASEVRPRGKQGRELKAPTRIDDLRQRF